MKSRAFARYGASDVSAAPACTQDAAQDLCRRRPSRTSGARSLHAVSSILAKRGDTLARQEGRQNRRRRKRRRSGLVLAGLHARIRKSSVPTWSCFPEQGPVFKSMVLFPKTGSCFQIHGPVFQNRALFSNPWSCFPKQHPVFKSMVLFPKTASCFQIHGPVSRNSILFSNP